MQRGALIVAALFTLGGAWYITTALSFPRGSLQRPGPGLYAILMGSLLTIAAIGTGVRAALAIRAGEDAAFVWPAGDGRLRILGMIAGALAYLVLLPQIGHLLAAF